MAEYPLLIFPNPASSERAKRSGRGRSIRRPDRELQAGRLMPQFERLQHALDKRKLVLQDQAAGIQPETALVLETIGPIENFLKTVRRVEGLEWLGEHELDDIPPMYGFEDKGDPKKHLKGRLFLIMTDQRALDEIQSLFNRWRSDPDASFPRGLAPLRNAFAHLSTIRTWNDEDRIRETGILEDWQERLRYEQQTVPFEAELWYREDAEKRQQAEINFLEVLNRAGGETLQRRTIGDIAYHGILGKVPADQVSAILGEDYSGIRLLQCEEVMFFRPVGQCSIYVPETSQSFDVLVEQPDKTATLESEPIVALFDGLPLSGHTLLHNRIIIDDPDSYESNYQARERRHGTMMASLICHGDLDGDGNTIGRPIYIRPILLPKRGYDNQFHEAIAENVLTIDLIERAVRRLFEPDGNQLPVAPSIRVINLSVCDRSRPFIRSVSSWAKLLDWLSWKYNVLFIVSAGNHNQDIELNVPRTEFSGLNEDELRDSVLEATSQDTRHRRILSPAETINGITVAASHNDASSATCNPHLIEPFTNNHLPNVISAHGPGYRRTIKPDVLLPGGRQLLREKPGNAHPNATLQIVGSERAPGQRVATPGKNGETDRTCYSRGTSNATALASRSAIFLFDVIEKLRKQSGIIIPPEYDAVLIKTLLVHGADWLDSGTVLESALNLANKRSLREHIGSFIGYGFVDASKVTSCTDQKAIVLGFGEIEDGDAHEYVLPLPPSLSATTQKRRLTVTLAWITPINSLHQKYRSAHLWVNPKNALTRDRLHADYNAVQRGTVQHEVLESDQAEDFQDGENIVLKINCRSDAGELSESIRYGLAVTLEVAEGVNIPIYQEIRNRLRVPVQI